MSEDLLNQLLGQAQMAEAFGKILPNGLGSKLALSRKTNFINRQGKGQTVWSCKGRG